MEGDSLNRFFLNMLVYIYVCVYIYIYIHTEAELLKKDFKKFFKKFSVCVPYFMLTTTSLVPILTIELSPFTRLPSPTRLSRDYPL